ncbi:hypothetical protein TcWFU_008578 [Taenia crassiceps]|uniref:Secreted protein n=1 Tax=Taenia crassiceps TaxID=6207 RepID=A0ABR4Q2N6_9CEST
MPCFSAVFWLLYVNANSYTPEREDMEVTKPTNPEAGNGNAYEELLPLSIYSFILSPSHPSLSLSLSLYFRIFANSVIEAGQCEKWYEIVRLFNVLPNCGTIYPSGHVCTPFEFVGIVKAVIFHVSLQRILLGDPLY